LNTGDQDGVPGLTECPLAPGETKTYTWKATQFGTTWFHSHFSAQYGDGATGQIIIDGPASSNYDVDLGAMPLTDWYYQDSWIVGLKSHNSLQTGGPPPPADTILINGTNVSPSNSQLGKYSKTTGLVAGKKYRLRLINMSIDNALRVSLDGHPFTVLTSDLVPIKPWTTNWILIGIGQRYDVIFTATSDNAKIGNFWLRVNYATQCFSSGNANPKALGIFSYNNAPSGNPTTTAYSEPADCAEPTTLVPWVSNTVDSSAFLNQVGNLNVDISVAGVNGNGQNIVVWGVNLTGIDVKWEDPTTKYVKEGRTDYPSTFNLISLPKEGIVSSHHMIPSR
jgi:FtsP/CotA-like multicopper oxidase with cupredoxin domain